MNSLNDLNRASRAEDNAAEVIDANLAGAETSAADSRQNLTALRKLYLRLDTQLANLNNSPNKFKAGAVYKTNVLSGLEAVAQRPAALPGFEAGSSESQKKVRRGENRRASTAKALSQLQQSNENQKQSEKEKRFSKIAFIESAFRIQEFRKRVSRAAGTTEPTREIRDIIELLQNQMSNSISADILNCGLSIEKPSELEIEIVLEELCKARNLLSLFDQRCSGYFYQWMCESARGTALERIQTADKESTKEDIIHFTQLYTPDWVADYLVRNTILPQINLNSRAVEELTILDPACGAGHIILAAFELLLELYRKTGISECEAIANILKFNLRACDIDAKALWVCGLALISKAYSRRKTLAEFNAKLRLANVSSANSNDPVNGGCETGSLRKTLGREFAPIASRGDSPSAHPLGENVDVVVANPPYIGRRLMDRRLKQFLKTNYPIAQHDISAAFLTRALELTNPGGFVAFITQSSLLFLPSYEKLRQHWLDHNSVESVIELGPGVFPLQTGEKINSMLIVLRNTNVDEESAKEDQYMRFADLRNSKDKQAAISNPSNLSYIHRSKRDFLAQRSLAFNYRCPPVLGQLLASSAKLETIAEVKQGLATSDNDKFIRFWWDVPADEIGKRWHPYMKGAGSERWRSPIETVVDWGKDGSKIKNAVSINYPYLKGKTAWVVKNERYYFRRGLTFSFVNTGQFAVRRMPEGCIFDVGGSSLFCEDIETENFLLAYLNSSFAALCAELINPTFNSQVGDIKQIPLLVLPEAQKKALARYGQEADKQKVELIKFHEGAITYTTPDEIIQILEGADAESIWQNLDERRQSSADELGEIERKIDAIILTSLQQHCLNSLDDLQIIESLLTESQSRRKNYLPKLDKKGFAEQLIRELVKRKFAKDQTFAFALKFDINDSTGEMQKQTYKQLELADNLRYWLAECIGGSVEEWLEESFNQNQERIFHGSPQIVMYNVKEKNSRSMIFVSALDLRNMHGDEDQIMQDNFKIEAAKSKDSKSKRGPQALVSTKVLQGLAEIENWTGKQLAQMLEANKNASIFFLALFASLLFATEASADVTSDIDTLLDKAATENADGNYVDAEMHYKQALRTSVSGMGAMSSMAGKLARDLGNYYAKRGQYSEAEHYLLRSLIVTSGYSDGLADSEGDFRNVRTFLSQAVQRPETLGSSIETANSLGSLADLYRRMGRYADAERMLQRVVQIYGGSSNNNQYFGADARKVLEDTQLSLGQVLVKQGKSSEAEVVYKAYVENVRKHYGNSPKVADALNHLASFYKGQDRSSESDAADAEAKEIMSQFR